MQEPSYLDLYQLILKQAPSSGDVIIWLQGDRFDRANKVLALYRSGLANKILLTGNNVLIGSGTRPGENNISMKEMQDWLLDHGVPSEAIILDDQSMNSKEQAIHCISLVKQKQWQKILLVGSSFYQPRAFLTFLKEAKSQDYIGKIINQPALIAEQIIPGGRNNTAGELMKSEAEKVKLYTADVVAIEDGIKYILSSTI